jgi:hypothetical protein
MTRYRITGDQDQTPGFSPVCTYCAHNTGFRRCRAFEGEIPLEIWAGENHHTAPYPGDHGVQFELAADSVAPHWLAGKEPAKVR